MRSSITRPSLQLRHAIAVVLALGAASAQLMHVATAQEAKADDVANLSDVNVSDDPLRALSNEPSAASFGFAKPLLETPRTVTFVSEEQLRLFGVSTVEDLSRLVPGTYSTTRYGLQGGINIRGVSADFYYRGMKRLNMQGHVRTILSAYDNIEVIKGPPSPLYGMGKIGGYANLDPKSNRAKTGKYMTKEQGYLQATVGNYQKNEMQFGLGVPFSVMGKTAGAYIVGLLEDSDTFVRTVPAKQKFIQATTSVDRGIGPFRVEIGGQTQNSITAGAYFTRLTQDLVDNDRYVTGRPLAELDLNRDGRVGYVETYLGSPTVDGIATANQALRQEYVLPRDAAGNPVKLKDFANTITGVPDSLQQYLTANAASTNCTLANEMRTATTLAPTNNGTLVSRNIPVGFYLNPCNTKVKTLEQADYRGNGAFEREQNATQRMAYFDMIYDTDPNFTVKNQFFYDSLSSYKDSWLPYGENQAIRAIEDKVTVTKRLPADWLPDWLSVNTLGSLNYRKTSGFILSSGGDFDYRQDITYGSGGNGSGTGGFYANTMFWTQLTNRSYQTGAVDTTNRRSTYSETGIGVMGDIDFFKNTNLLIGGRVDKVTAKAQDLYNFNANSGSVAAFNSASLNGTIASYINGTACLAPGTNCPGNYVTAGIPVKDSDTGISWSASLSHKLPWFSLVPYITKAVASLPLDASNNLYATGTIANINSPSGQQTSIRSYTNKLIGEAGMTELGIKGAAFRGKMQWTLAGFIQERTDVSVSNDPSVGVEVTSTKTKGIEGSVNFQLTKKLFVGASAQYAQARYLFGLGNISATTGLPVGTAVDVNARDLGFRDFVASDGTVYPAEAYLYGGRAVVQVYDPNNFYDEVPGTPEFQAAMNVTYSLPKGFGLLGNVQYFSESWASRLQLSTLPAATTINIGATWDSPRIHVKANIYNLTDDIVYRATNGGNRNMASVLPDRRYEASLKVDF